MDCCCAVFFRNLFAALFEYLGQTSLLSPMRDYFDVFAEL